MQRIFSVVVFVILVHLSSLACTFNNTTGDGLWSTNGNWSCGTAPGVSSTYLGNVTISASVIVDVDVNINGSVPFDANGHSFTVNSGVTFECSGDFGSASRNNSGIFVEGTMIVRGDIYFKNNSTVQGGGALLAKTINLGNNTVCGTGCPTIYTETCTDGSSWCATSGSITVTSGTLPVELIDFMAKMFRDRAHLEWKTASEINNDYFIIERNQGGEWIAIGQIHGMGNSNELHLYEYDDYEVDPYQIAYYRLVQVDFDGHESVSEAIKAESFELQGHEYKIFMSGTRIQLVFEDDHNEITEVMLVNSQGNVLKKYIYDRTVKGQTVSFDLSLYPRGWYIVGITGADNFHFEKMMLVE